MIITNRDEKFIKKGAKCENLRNQRLSLSFSL